MLICYVPLSNLVSTLPELSSLELNGILPVGPALLVWGFHEGCTFGTHTYLAQGVLGVK